MAKKKGNVPPSLKAYQFQKKGAGNVKVQGKLQIATGKKTSK